MRKRVLVTGAAGFIGFYISKRLLQDEGCEVVGVDNMSAYYDVGLKQARLRMLEDMDGFRFHRLDIADSAGMEELFKAEKFDVVINLAAQAGVRHSLKDPQSYIKSNVEGFVNVLEGCRHADVGHLVFASSSSVYGANTKMPFSVHHNVDHPVSLYAATKKSNELMAHAYSSLYGVPATGLRFFTVYGPWGRPDMALFLFTKAIIDGQEINVFNHGRMKRDFTYIDDIIEGVVRVAASPPSPNPDWDSDAPDPGTSYAPYMLYNIGNNNPVGLTGFIEAIEEALGKKAKKRMLPLQPGDVPESFADIDGLARDFDFKPSTPIKEGIARFVSWYRDYYGA